MSTKQNKERQNDFLIELCKDEIQASKDALNKAVKEFVLHSGMIFVGSLTLYMLF